MMRFRRYQPRTRDQQAMDLVTTPPAGPQRGHGSTIAGGRAPDLENLAGLYLRRMFLSVNRRPPVGSSPGACFAGTCAIAHRAGRVRFRPMQATALLRGDSISATDFRCEGGPA